MNVGFYLLYFNYHNKSYPFFVHFSSSF